MGLRDYQNSAVADIRKLFAGGRKRVLLHLATGAGKTVVFSHILQNATVRALLVVRGRKLVDQASQRLIRENVPHGVCMAGHWLWRPSENVQVCSIDTLIARRMRPEARLIVIDEVHMATSEGYRRFLAQYPDAFILGVTATPYTDKPLDDIVTDIVHPITFQQLVDQKYLVPPKYFCPAKLDLTGVRVSSSTKDYVTSELETACDTNALVGDLVSHWKQLAAARPTICFAVSVKHSLHIVESFKAAGIPAEHVEAETSDKERSAVLARLERGETKIVSNVGILCTGVDMPTVSCILMARPTKSYCLYIQQLGRGTRTFAGKTHFLVLDHADNVRRHGFIEDEPPANLEGKFTMTGASAVKICGECFGAYKGRFCPECGVVASDAEDNQRILEVRPGELREITKKVLEEEKIQEATAYYDMLRQTAALSNFKPGWIFYRMKEQFGEELANEVCNKRRIPAWVRR